MVTKNSPGLYPWSKDLEASSDVRLRERESFAMLFGWLEKFVARQSLPPGRTACERFWKEQVRSKPRERWQIEQWGAAIRWYLRWLEHQQARGGEVRTLPERVRDAVDRAGARRGHAPRTRETYGRWVAAFAVWAGDSQAVMRPDKARDVLSWQVAERKVSYDDGDLHPCGERSGSDGRNKSLGPTGGSESGVGDGGQDVGLTQSMGYRRS